MAIAHRRSPSPARGRCPRLGRRGRGAGCLSRQRRRQRLSGSRGQQAQAGADRRWSVMAVFFTSDTHFGDHRTLNIWKRPFGSVAEMDSLLLERWNAAVGPEDEVWHLGDFARKPGDVPALLERLHGAKHLVRGNNDPPGSVPLPFQELERSAQGGDRPSRAQPRPAQAAASSDRRRSGRLGMASGAARGDAGKIGFSPRMAGPGYLHSKGRGDGGV
jgi:hypothetical protein